MRTIGEDKEEAARARSGGGKLVWSSERPVGGDDEEGSSA